jgi:hypothetical protein
MDDGDDRRKRGVELGRLARELEQFSYPVDEETLREQCGGHELDLEGGTTTLGDVLERGGKETYESRADVERRILTLVDTDAVGREGYSDRGGTAPGIERDYRSL